VRLVVADTGPLNYLILIDQIRLLPILFEKVVLPIVVRNEMISPKAPQVVRLWIESLPPWVEVLDAPPHQLEDASLVNIDASERAAIQLANALSADLLLMDDRKGVAAAQRKGLHVTGTLGIFDLGAERGHVDFAQAIAKLRHTNFRAPQSLLESLLRKHQL
jgi:predicted nucleic acid-binding protein